MNRSNEFRQIIEMLGAPGRPAPPRLQPRAAERLAQTRFGELTKKLSSDLELSAEKLEKLELLCELTTGDRVKDIQELVQIIKQDITVMNSQIVKLNGLVRRRIGSGGERPQFMKHLTGIVSALQRKLGAISAQFKMLLESEGALFKAAAAPKPQQAAPQQQPQPLGISQELRSRGGGGGGDSGGNAAVGIDMSGADQQAMMAYDYEEEKRRERDKTTSTMESTISELGNIFKNLATVVQEQGETLQRIDDDVADTMDNVDLAHTEISKYLKSVSSNRMLILQILAILLLLFTIMMIIT